MEGLSQEQLRSLKAGEIIKYSLPVGEVHSQDHYLIVSEVDPEKGRVYGRIIDHPRNGGVNSLPLKDLEGRCELLTKSVKE